MQLKQTIKIEPRDIREAVVDFLIKRQLITADNEVAFCNLVAASRQETEKDTIVVTLVDRDV